MEGIVSHGQGQDQHSQDGMESRVQVYRPCGIPVLALILVMACLVQSTSAEEFGSLRLCPSGGRSFMMAWNLACEMKRKKRSVPNVSDVVLGTPSSRPGALSQEVVSNPDKEKEAKRKRAAPEGYRPATLTEIMRICCDVGCEVRDLLAYCDPFGPWNS